MILNLETLSVDIEYRRVLSAAGPTRYTEGIGRYGNSQREVVLDVSHFSIQEIWSWGGYSSPIEQIAELINGGRVTSARSQTRRLTGSVPWLRSEA